MFLSTMQPTTIVALLYALLAGVTFGACESPFASIERDPPTALLVSNRTESKLYIAPGKTVEPCGELALSLEQLNVALDAQEQDSFVAPPAPGGAVYLSLHIMTVEPGASRRGGQLIVTSEGSILEARGVAAEDLPPCTGEAPGPDQ